MTLTNHAFVDGNKRIGVYIMLSFLEMSGIRLHCSDEEIIRTGLSIADGLMDYDRLLDWIWMHE